MSVRGFTLIEVLAVIVILSIVAGVATVGLVSATDSARLAGAISQWRDLDARARLFSRTTGPVVMDLNRDHTIVRLVVVESGERLSRIELPPDVTGHFRTDRPTDAIVFDRTGGSVDYEVQMHTDDGVVRWHVYGLTGQAGGIMENKP